MELTISPQQGIHSLTHMKNVDERYNIQQKYREQRDTENKWTPEPKKIVDQQYMEK
jgi:hypothetical protein